MNHNNVYNTKANTCRGCSLLYDFYYRNNCLYGRIPMILHCKHILCEECVKRGIREYSLTCPECKVVSTIPKNQDSDTLYDTLPINFYILGMVQYLKTNAGSNEKFKPTGLRLMSVARGFHDSDDIESERCITNYETSKEECSQKKCTSPASLRCSDCAEVYCEKCCDTIHKMARGFKTHKISPLNNATFADIKEGCDIHPTGIIDFHCNTCDKDICCYCVINLHFGHDYYQLNELKESDKPALRQLIDAVQVVVKQLQTTQKVVNWNLKQNKVTHKVCPTEATITRYFAELHGRLQLEERRLKNELVVMKNFNYHRLNLINREIQTTLAAVNSYVTTAKSVVSSEGTAVKVNVNALIEKLKNCLTVPCFLVGQKQSQDVVNFAPSLALEELESMFSIKANTQDEFRLVVQEALPADYSAFEVHDVSDSLSFDSSTSFNASESMGETVSKILSRSSSRVSNDSIVDNIKEVSSSSVESLVGKIKPKETPVKPVQVRSDESPFEKVTVVHINSPESFYVQFAKTQPKLNKLNSEIMNHIKHLALVVQEPQLHKLYAVKYAAQGVNQWCRGKVIDINVTSDANNRDFNYVVLYIDFGNTQKVRKEYLREIPTEIASVVPLAHHCKLFDLYPKNDVWEKDALTLMAKILGDNEVLLYRKDTTNAILEVDLLVYTKDCDSSSVRDALMFTGHGIPHLQNETTPVMRPTNDGIKLFKNENKFQERDIVQVLISHVESPEEIYVQIAEHIPQLEKLEQQMLRYYKQRKGHIYTPKKDMKVVVVTVDETGCDRLYRAEIVDIIQGKGMIKVFCVDDGKTITTNWQNLFRLQQQFTYLECQANLVKLADVAKPNDAENWPQEATQFLEQFIYSKEILKMVVGPSEMKPTSVVLFEEYPTADMCINANLVQKGYAMSTGNLSTKLNWDKCVNAGNGQAISQIIRESKIHDGETEVAKFFVEILKVVNPDEIYVKVLLESLKQDLCCAEERIQKFYNTDLKRPKEPALNEICVVYCEQSNTFYRAKITDVVEDEVKVFLVDTGRDISVQKSQVYECDEKFKKWPHYALRCHLSGIYPAGDSKKWSQTAIEFLKATLKENTNICMNKSGPIDTNTKSFPVTMWYGEFIPGGALEPSTTKWHTINLLLIERGLALRIRETAANAAAHMETENLSSSDDSSEQQTQNRPIDCREYVQSVLGELAETNDYLPPLPVNTDKFDAHVTYVGLDGTIFVQLQSHESIFDEMVANMKGVFDKVAPEPPGTILEPGEMCTAFYHETRLWYRGKVLNREDGNNYKVLMIDFGNEETYPLEELRKSTMYKDVPSFAYKLRLYGVYAKNDKWVTSDLDFLHNFFSNRVVTVVVKERQVPGESLQAEVFTDDGQNVNEFIVSASDNLSKASFHKCNEIDDDDDVIILEENIETPETKLQYVFSQLPSVGTTIEAGLINIIDYNTILIEVIDDTLDNEIFSKISVEMQQTGHQQPILEDLSLGAPCIALFSEDLKWYRGQIMDINEDSATVWFVDYGNAEDVAKQDIRQIKESWIKFPVEQHPAKIANVRLVDESSARKVVDCLLNFCSSICLVRFESVEPLEVTIMDKVTGKMLYEKLIQEGVLVLI